MAAATAVFDTYELLEHILVQLPAASITKCSRVCSTWRQLIRDSSRIREAHTLRPKARSSYPTLLYESSEPIKFLPMLRARTTPILGPEKWIRLDFFVPFRILRNDSARSEYEQQYISNPPISRIYIGYCAYPLKPKKSIRENDNECVLRNPKGITMGDLLETTYAVEETERKYNVAANPSLGKGSADVGFATAWIQVSLL